MVRVLIAESLKSDPQLSNREHARRTGANHETVGSVRKGMESTGEIRQSEKRVSGDGRVRPASQPPCPEPAPPAPGFEPGDLDDAPAPDLDAHGHQVAEPLPTAPARNGVHAGRMTTHHPHQGGGSNMHGELRDQGVYAYPPNGNHRHR